jgi:hypothetical protein
LYILEKLLSYKAYFDLSYIIINLLNYQVLYH